MINQETYVKSGDLHKQGWTIKEIATETGLFPGHDLQVAPGGPAGGAGGVRSGQGDDPALGREGGLSQRPSRATAVEAARPATSSTGAMA